ncbi:hypothetical protein DK28_0210530 [Peptococcaceae bacterium SCADC1_2_3]|nr:hypothetical protein DK28_0210530 [Peptococcaceae bacterium SCADC1_2_3]
MRIGISALQLSNMNSGIGQYIYCLVSALLKQNNFQDHECLIYFSKKSTPQEWQGHPKIITREIPFTKEQALLRNIFELFLYGNILEREKLSLAWFPDTKAPLQLSPKIPFVVTVHDLAIIRLPHTYQTSRVIYWRKLFKHAVKRAIYIIAISQSTKKDLVNLMGINSEKIKVIYNGVADNFKIITDEELLVRVRKKYRLPEQYLLFVGLFSPRKNIAGLLKAFAILKKKYAIPHKLLMVGEKGWKYKSDLALVDSLGIAEEVIFTGYVKNEELPAIYTMASAFVFPSLYEGFGLPILEAMACGTPVVTSNISAMPEVVGDAGILVEPNDPLGIAEAIYRLISDKQLAKELTSLGFQRVHCFTWEKAAREMITLFQESKM